MARHEKRNKSRGSAGNNRKLGEEFLQKNKIKTNIIETESGLQYEIIEDVPGETPKDNSYIEVHQRCWLINGKVIEDTFRENKTSKVKMQDLIDGYQEGLQLMSKGSRYKLYIPPDLAWGKKGSGNKIPPNSVLIFDVRLIDFW